MSGRKSKIIAGTVLLLLVMCFVVFLYRNSTRGQFESSLPSEYSSDVTTLRYYKAYASYYLGNFGAEVPLDITIDGKETA